MTWLLIVTSVCLDALLAGLLVWEKYQNRIERAKLINAVIGKNAQEIASLDLADKTDFKVQKSKPEIVPLENMDDEDFDKLIKKQNG